MHKAEEGAPRSPVVPPKRSKASPERAEPPGPARPSPSPPVFTRKMRNAAVGTGCDIRLKVTVAGDPQPSLYWYHNDGLLNMENQEYGGLWIRDCKPSDAGLYTCIANNHLGEARSSAVLAVLDLGEESDTTEDEAGEQFETKDNSVDCEDHAAHTAVMDKYADDETETRSQSNDSTRDSPPHVLPPSSPRLVKRHSTSPMPSRSTTPLSLRKKTVVPAEYQDTVPAEFEEKVKMPKSLSQSNTNSSRPQTPLNEQPRKEITPRPSPKLTRASSKVFEKVRDLEERRRSLDFPEGSVSGRSWAGFNRAGSVDSDDGGSRLGISRESSREDLREALKEDAAERRSMFKQRAASLEDKPRYSQKVQDIENKFTEELQRIKKLVGKPHLKKSFSTEQLSMKARQRQPFRKIEPIPPQVLQRLQERERSQWVKEKKENGLHQQSVQLGQLIHKSESSGIANIHPESMQLSDLPGQRSVREFSRVSPVTEIIQRSSSPALFNQQMVDSPGKHNPETTIRKLEKRPPSPLVQRISRTQESPQALESPVQTQLNETSGRKTPIEVALRKIENRPESPLVRKRVVPVQGPCPQAPPKPPRMTPANPTEAELPKQPPNIRIPTIIVEDEQVRKDVPVGHPQKTKVKHRRPRPMSPELDSSDDSYISAEEDPMEAPLFEFPLQDTVATSGSEVLLRCIVTGYPIPEVTWTKDNVDISGIPNYAVKVEGDRHSLLIKSANVEDGGKYSVSAVNQEGKVSSTANLTIKAEPIEKSMGVLGVPIDISSPITSDDEYLSPLEEASDISSQEPKRILDTAFKKAPEFLATINDQVVVEGQEITMSVQISGQPKPLLYWLRGRVTVKTGPRHLVRETENGTFEMSIKSAVRSDTGIYTCKIINEYGTKQCEGKLEVKAAPVEPGLAVIRPVRDITANAGDTVLFECHVIGPKDTDVDWLADGKLIQPALLNCKMHFDGRKCRLLLNSVHEDDTGTYMCKLSTAKEEVTSCGKLKVIPSAEPLFTRKLDVLEVIEGRNARFDCKVSGTPRPKVVWTHFADHPLTESEDIRILQENGRHSLIISHVTNDDEGFYTVTATNCHGESECSAELYIQEPRPAISSQMAKLEKMPSIPEEPEVPENEVERFTMPDFIKPLYDLDVIEGKEAVLKCKVAGLPYPTIAWFHNGRRIESTEDRKMTQFRDVHSLVLRSVGHGHGGVYKSVISNKIGKATCYAHLYVTDILPDPPDGTPVIESITGKVVILSWKKPRRLDPSIEPKSLMYAIQQQALGSIQWTIIASGLKETTYTISTLSKGVRYSFRILTITSKAFSKPSAATDPVLLLDRGPYLQEAPVIIDKPEIVFVMENQSVTISVTINHVNAATIWKRNGAVLDNKAGVHEMAMPDDDQHTLKLIKVKSADIGEMMFVASNKYGSDSCTFTVEMAAPPTFETIMEDIDVCCGETPRFAVVVEGRPVPDILWFKNDALLSEGSHYTFVYDDNECSLLVLNACQGDSGVYTCTARNLAGSVSCKAELTVHEALNKEEPMEDEETILRKLRRLTDQYDIHKEIGRGAFSYIKRVTRKEDKLEYAAKFISTRAKKKTSALREMSLLSKMDHERVLLFHDAFEKKNAVIILTEICHEEILDRFTRKSALLESDVHSCIRQLLEGLDYLHHINILHLDIKPDNILMADAHSDQIRICDFGNALEITPDEAQYCKYGTPEFVAPEIVNQTPVSKATDIWPVGVIAYLCLTGVSPFAGENDRFSVMNIRNYNVAFEENMFAHLSREAKGFIIKLLVADRLRPDTQECLRHPWFKTLSQGAAINTEAMKKFVSRRRWQRSIISYKSKMVMRSIPELLNDSSSHISIAVPRHLKEASPLPSSSSDSDEDIDELPFIPMPLNMEFSGSRMSLNDIQTNEKDSGKQNGSNRWSTTPETMKHDMSETDKESPELTGKSGQREGTFKDDNMDLSEEESPADLPLKSLKRKPLKRGSSMESDKPEGGRKKGELRRGSSADSALLLRITPEEGGTEGSQEGGKKVLKKAVSMELPKRSTSPGTANMSKEDYALKLELMRQRLLRGGSVDKKMSGLRGPLLETLGMGNEKCTLPSDRYSRTNRLGPASLTRAASSDLQKDDISKPKVLNKSASFSQGDSEPIALHRRSGAPLEIPVALVEERRLKEAISMSALTEQFKLDSRPVTPREPSPNTPTPDFIGQKSPIKTESKDSLLEKEIKPDTTEKLDRANKDIGNVDERSSTSGFSEKDMSISEDLVNESEYVGNTSPSPFVVVQSTELKEKQEEVKPKEQKEKEQIVKEYEKGISSVASSKVPEEKLNEIMPEIITTSNSVTTRPTQESSETTTKVSPYSTPSVTSPVVLPDGRTSAYASIMQTIMVPSIQPLTDIPLSPSTPVVVPKTTLSSVSTSPTVPGPHKPHIVSTTEHAAVYSRVASPETITKDPSPPKTTSQSAVGMDVEDITSEEIFEARFKKRESSLTRSLKFLTRSKNEGNSQITPPDATESGEVIYRPGPLGAPLEFSPRKLEEKSKSVQDLREAQKDQGFMRRLSMRLKRTPSTERKGGETKEEDLGPSRRRLSWTLGRRGSQDKKEVEMTRLDGGSNFSLQKEEKEPKKPNESPVLTMRRKIESTVAGISTRIRSYSEERKSSEEKEPKKTPILSILRRATSENRGMKGTNVQRNQLASQATNGASTESLDSMSSLKSDTSKGIEGEGRSRWDRWGLTRGRRSKTVSQPDIPTAISREASSIPSRQYSRLASDFPPVFHIKLRDHILLEGDPVTLSCLPAGSPHPHITWMKDKKPVEIDDRMNMIACPDGRQLLMIMQTTKKDAGVYECVATNPIASVSSSCTISLARLPNQPGTPEIPQKYNNTALVLWRPSDTIAPCTYSLERKAEGETNFLIVATGVADCYYNVVDLPAGGLFRFRVACVNKAGQGPYSNLSEVVRLDASEPAESSATVVVKTAAASAPQPPAVIKSSMTIPPMKPVPNKATTQTFSQHISPSTPGPVPSEKSASPKIPQPTKQVELNTAATTTSVISAPSKQAPAQANTIVQTTAGKTKSILSISVGKPQTKLNPPPVVPPKPQTPNKAFVSISNKAPSPSPVPSSGSVMGKPISSVPMYAPAGSTHGIQPSQSTSTTTITMPSAPARTIFPPVVLVQSLTPVAQGADSRGTPSGRVTPAGRVTPSGRRTPLGKAGEGHLRQGVPQKPYTFMDEKARGRFGVIRECRENATGNLFMAKIVPYEAENKQVVLQEYDILKSLHHDRIMALHEAYVTPRYLVLISEYCSGKEILQSLIDRFRYSEDDVVSYVVQILQGLDYLHTRRILHLDIKPENIIVTHMNVIKIIDFGSAQNFNPLFLKQFSPPVGTLEYMSPEMLKGDVVGPPADIWSVGVITFMMLSGRSPFMENDPQQTEMKIQAAKFDLSKLYQNVSQSASLFLKKILCSYPWARASIKECLSNSWLQDAYLMRLRRQTLTFTTVRLKEFLADQQRRREELATKHKVLLRSYQSSPQTPSSPATPTVPNFPVPH
ncbi:striated muscle preferentially expressed protein kinase isoform X1 [Nerophis ophidion]|uniref:striated muscle preferentially expressed protein kinase isoform X1 n=1 Tax=Nerophis ophidion TaxID=159077 RepID=UPI002ADF1AC9|nr:striated muscle preferentially expressed protein kinase isoform X1 [Nerophis ophidion]